MPLADLLSVYWSVTGQPVMEPSGTYSYAAETAQGEGPRLPRDYFRRPAASNGIVLYGHDPLGNPKGRFRGSDNGTRVTMQWRSLDCTLGWAGGRLDESGPLNGHRRGVLHLAGRYTVVYHRLPPLPRDGEVACHWQLAPEAKVMSFGGRQASFSLDSHSILVCAGGRPCRYGLPARSVRSAGRLDIARLWAAASCAAADRRPRARGRDMAFVFGVVEARERLPTVDIRAAKQNGLPLDVMGDGHSSIACIGGVSVGRDILPFDLDFQGDVLWLDVEGESCRETRALGLRGLRSSALGLNLVPGAWAWPMHGHRRPVEHQAEIDVISGRWEYRSND